jgi:hydroxyethylthiazole kinase
MLEVALACRTSKKPWVLDPVGAGASKYRTKVIADLARLKPTVLRGNPSEIMVVAAQLGITSDEPTQAGRGADGTVDSAEILASPRIKLVDALALEIGGVVVMTGSMDYITDGANDRYVVCHDVPSLQAITATGCSLSSLIAAFIALDSEQPARAAAHACAMYSLAAEEAARTNPGMGPGSMRAALLDALHHIDAQTMRAMTRIGKVDLN